MRAVRTPEGIIPISELKAKLAEWIRRAAETGQPLVITQNSETAGALLPSGELDRLSGRARFDATVEEGLADADAGLLRDHGEVMERMRTRFRRRRI